MRNTEYQVTVNSSPPVAFFVRAADEDLAVSKLMAGDYDRRVEVEAYPDADAGPDELMVSPA